MMSLFDGQGLNAGMPANLAEMGRGVGQSISKGLLDPYMESQGYTSEENQVLKIMEGTDLTSAESIADAFSTVMAINQQAEA